jgi:predicted nucleic acid-binding protein
LIFVDSNVPMYVIGAEHPLKHRSVALLRGALERGERLVADVEVLQEIVHRYVAIDRREAIQPAFDALLAVVDDVLPVHLEHLLRAKEVVLASRHVSSRDALHVAVMEVAGITRLLSFDRGFDTLPGLTRVS